MNWRNRARALRKLYHNAIKDGAAVDKRVLYGTINKKEYGKGSTKQVNA